mmetsp:Transcript_23420/g.32831  ORF Transcript_23420/g.32831 Transcript_23420/m.32831 type:complete len:416 (+) Transcript_23420:155-1402(+)
MSSYVDSSAGATEHCEQMANVHADLADRYTHFASLVNQKLWHQLTMDILSFVSEGNAHQNLRETPEGTNSFFALYQNVVLAVDKKLNPLSLARIASVVATSLESDGTAARAVLENLLEKKTQLGPIATLYTESKLALLKLQLLEKTSSTTSTDSKSELSGIKEILTSNGKTLSEMQDAVGEEAALVHSAHYECAMIYRKAVGPPEAFYREAISYLNYTPLESLKGPDRYQLATDLSLAALTGDGVFNFGEVLVSTPILSELDGTENHYLVELMNASAKGDVLGFQSITERHGPAIQNQPALVNRATTVKEKITLMALVNMVFERPSTERILTFADVAERIHLPVDQVELVVMRALSLGLIKGSMDQVDQTITVTWVMPRVLDKPQLQELATRFGKWAIKVSQTKDTMSEQTPMLA